MTTPDQEPGFTSREVLDIINGTKETGVFGDRRMVSAEGGEVHRYVPLCDEAGCLPTERICEDCMEGAHETCRREGGWMHQDTDERCGCHLTAHALDNRKGV